MKRYVCSFVAAAIAAGVSGDSTQAQEPSLVRVRVIEATGRPVEAAAVQRHGSDTRSLTDSSGRTSVRASPGDTLTVRKPGWLEAQLIVAPEHRDVEATVTLSPITVLEDVIVARTRSLVPSLERRRSHGRGTFYGPEDLAAAHSVRTLLGKTRDLKLHGSGPLLVTFRHPNFAGDCFPDVYIDGLITAAYYGGFNLRRKEALEKFEALDTFAPSALHAIEVYPRAAQAPPEFVGVRDGCGVILAWTEQWAERQRQQSKGEPRR